VTHHVVFAAYDGVEVLDVAGPASVFSAASALKKDVYRVTVAAAQRSRNVQAGSVRIAAERALNDVRRVDTLIVPGAFGVARRKIDAALVRDVKAAAKRAKRVASVCTGAFVLGAAGLLDGKRVVTHWAGCAFLRELHPTCTVEEDAIFVRDGSLWTSAGVTAGIDLALAIVEHDHGRELALEIARWLVVYLHRQGGQSQFSAPLRGQRAEREPLRDVVRYMHEHPGADLGVPALAKRAGMSERNFARVFRREIGTTPAAHAENVRVEVARRALETTTHPMKRIASDCGFGTVETFHRVFQRVLGVTPSAYRSRFETRTAT
jgi:transcriptional regulator GlxA family with amidase domain